MQTESYGTSISFVKGEYGGRPSEKDAEQINLKRGRYAQHERQIDRRLVGTLVLRIALVQRKFAFQRMGLGLQDGPNTRLQTIVAGVISVTDQKLKQMK